MITWRMVGSVGRDGLLPIESSDGKRIAADVRGGIAWPWPVAVGARLVAAGAVAVVGYVPEQRRAYLLRWWLTGTIGPVMGEDQWPIDGGVVGALREAALALGCWRWTTLCRADDQVESVRAVRRHLPDMQAVRVTAVDDQVAPDDVRALLFRWATERRLNSLPDEAVREVEREEGELVGPRPLTTAIAAALEGFERRPWRPAQVDPWAPIPRDVLAR